MDISSSIFFVKIKGEHACNLKRLSGAILCSKRIIVEAIADISNQFSHSDETTRRVGNAGNFEACEECGPLKRWVER